MQYRRPIHHAIVILVWSLVSLLWASGSAWAEGQVTAEFSRVDDASHLEFKGRANWKYNLRRESTPDGDRLILQVPRLEEKSMNKLRTHADSLIKSIQVNENGVDDSHEVVFHLTSPKVDNFDYLTEQPSKLIIDFFPKDEDEPVRKTATASQSAPSPAETAPTSAPVKLPAKTSAAATTDQGKDDKNRQPAGEFLRIGGNDPVRTEPVDPSESEEFTHGIFDGGDTSFKRFSIADHEIREDAVIASRGNIYLHFPMLQIDSPHLKTILSNPPIYEIVPKETDENKEARLLLTLFTNKRPAVFLRTAKDFLKRYPASSYDEIVRYMMADVHYDLWEKERSAADFESAMTLYRNLTEKYPQSPLTTRTLLLMGYSYLSRGDSFGTLKTFQRFLTSNPDSTFADQVKVSIGEAYLNLNKYDDAFNIFDEVEKAAKNKRDAIDAAYRKGDIFFRKKDYPRAISQYKEAVQKYPEAAGRFPNASFNLAEAEFWMGHHMDSLTTFRQHLQRFPDHGHGGYAMTRLGELLEILGAPEKRVMGAFMESWFRYRATPGASVARVRLLVQRMTQMKSKEMKSSLNEIDELKTKTELADFGEFVTFMLGDGYYNRQEFAQATDMLVTYYQQNPNSAYHDKFKTRIVRNITEGIKTSVEKGKFIDALRLHSRYSASWLKGSDRIDTRYYVGRAFEQAGVFKEASEVYRESLNKLYAIKGTNREKERNVFEILPSSDSLNLRLAVVAARERGFARSADHLRAVADPKNFNEDERIEYASVSADVEEARGQAEAAQKHLKSLVDTWAGKPVAVAPVLLRLANLQMQSKRYSEAETGLNRVLNLQTDSGLVPQDIHARALEAKGDLLVATDRREEAVKAYSDLLESYENRRPLASVRYRMGKLLFEQGDFKGAEEAWAPLKNDANDSNGMWYRLASEQLEGARWKGDYKKYIDRIPAMSDSGATRKE